MDYVLFACLTPTEGSQQINFYTSDASGNALTEDAATAAGEAMQKQAIDAGEIFQFMVYPGESLPS